jgi:hypothetical protein
MLPDDASFVTAREETDHRVEVRVLVLGVLVRLGEVVDGTLGWDKIEVGLTDLFHWLVVPLADSWLAIVKKPLVPRLRLLASNPLVSYVLPPLIRNPLVEELTRWHRELATKKYVSKKGMKEELEMEAVA